MGDLDNVACLIL